MEDPGVADHGVDASELVHGLRDDRLAACRAVDRVIGRHGTATSRSDLVDHLVRDADIGAVATHAAAEIVDHDRRTPPSQVERVQPPETAARTGHHHHLVPEVDHASPSVTQHRASPTSRAPDDVCPGTNLRLMWSRSSGDRVGSRRFGEPPHPTRLERLLLALEHQLLRYAEPFGKQASEPIGQHDLAGGSMALEA